jgi:glutathione S-transferase
MLTLYFRPMACSLASRIAILEAGLDVRYRAVDLISKKVADGSDYLVLSAKGQVPILVLADGQILTEGAAVLQYIADQNPDAGLAPIATDPNRYRLQEWLNFVATELHKAFLYPVFSHDTPEAVKAHARVKLARALAVAADQLDKAPFVTGDRFTVADAYLTWALLLIQFGGVELQSSLAAYLQRAQQRPHVRDAIQIERQMLQAPAN